MNYKNSKHIKNRRIGEEELELLFGAFSQLCEGDKKGCICVTVKGPDFGEFRSGDHSVLDEMKMRRKAVSEVEFSYRSADYDSRAYISLRDEFLLDSPYHGMSLSLDSSDRQWFDATWKKMGDVLDAIPSTSFVSRLLNKAYGVVSIVISMFLILCTVILFFRAIGMCGVVVPKKYNILFVLAGIALGALYTAIVSNFVCRNFPVIDLDIYKHRSETRRMCATFFWWLMGIIGSLTIATFIWPFERQDKVKHSTESSPPATVITNTDVTI